MRLDILDGLRGLAILLVVVFHVWQQSWWNPLIETDAGFLQRRGYMGVELFFFLSGFCLYWPLVQEEKLNRWGTYFLRRALKIVPSYLLSIALVLYFKPTENLGFQLWTHLTFTHPFFEETYSGINGVLWSLGVEVQFYLLFPLVVLLFRKSTLVGALALATLACLYRAWVFRTFHTSLDGPLYTLRMNQLPAFLDLFAGGMLAAVLVSRRRTHTATLWSGLGMLVGLVGFYLLLRSFNGHDQGRNAEINWQAIVRTPFAVLLIGLTVAGAGAPAGVRWLLVNPPLAFLARSSYNLYLWHAFIGWRLREAELPPFPSPEPWQSSPAWGMCFTWMAYTLSLTAAALLTTLVEQPLLRWGRRFIAPAAHPSEAPVPRPAGE